MTSSFQIVDTHCHLEEPEFDADLDEVIRQAVRSGVYMITPAIREDTWERALGISRNHGSVSLALRLDPTRCYQVEPAQDFISANQKQLIALREVGFDHYRERDHKKREDQEKSFRLMIALAKEIGLPLQVHSRSAGGS